MRPKYLPREAIVNQREDDPESHVITKKLDVWSMGCMISEMFSRTPSWTNKFKDEPKILLQCKRVLNLPLKV